MKAIRITLATFVLLTIFVANPQAAMGEDCPVIDFSKLSFGNPPPTARWKNSDPVRVITWASNATFIAPDPVSTVFTTTEQEWLQQAFDSYGEVLDSIAFQRVENPDTANILIGYTLLSKGKIPTETTGGNFGLWGFNPSSQKGGIQLLDSKLWPKNFKFYKSQSTFILPIQNEIGNMLGVPDVDPFGPKQSLVTIYDTSKFDLYGQLKINDYDAAIIRQLYGESTCSSKYSQDARAKNLAADKIAGANYLAKLAQTTPTPVQTKSAKMTTITCIKGKSTKKVTDIKPVCPKGYKKK
jgi:hypothetical protein